MSQVDPTDHALAAIASILDHKEAADAKLVEPQGDETEVRELEAEDPNVKDLKIEESAPENFQFEEVRSEEFTAGEPEHLPHVAETHDIVVAEHDAPTTVPEAVEVDGYSRLGPGPLDAIRFRWTARRSDDGSYYVDETIGTSSRPIASGPMQRDDVIAFIDGRERAARERFNALKSEMTIGHRPSPERHTFADSESSFDL